MGSQPVECIKTGWDPILRQVITELPLPYAAAFSANDAEPAFWPACCTNRHRACPGGLTAVALVRV